jgi:hypothetical protein
LKLIADRLDSKVFAFIEDYIRDGNVHSLWYAVDAFTEKQEMDIYTAILEVSKQYQEGAKKYSDRNWEKGMPVHCFIDSGVRHYLKFLRGDEDEPHDRAFIWNMLGAIWIHENHPELIDLPFIENSKPNSFVHDEKISNNALPRLSQFELGTHNHGAVPPIVHKVVPHE